MATLISIIMSVALLLSLSLASTIMRYDEANQEKKSCGWELMQNLEIPISNLGNWYAAQTGDHSLCTRQDDGSEYCTCIYECGNGVWVGEQSNDEEVQIKEWTWTEGCKKYCHVGVCDGQD